jgi:hypothetical protein
VAQASQAAEKVIYFVIPSEARNLSSIQRHEKKERFLASLGMTKGVGPFFRSLFSLWGFVLGGDARDILQLFLAGLVHLVHLGR